MSQAELGRRLGVSCVSICQYENCLKYPRPSNLPRIAYALGCTIDALYGRGSNAAIACKKICEVQDMAHDKAIRYAANLIGKAGFELEGIETMEELT